MVDIRSEYLTAPIDRLLTTIPKAYILLRQINMPRLNNDQRNQAIGMLNAGSSVADVCRLFNCTRAAINRLRRRFQVRGNVHDRPRSGRPRVTTAADDHYITVTHLRNRRLCATVTARRHGISAQTVRNRLRSNPDPIRAYRPYFGQILTDRHRAARRDWCRRHRRFRRADWRSVLFSDESRFNVSHADGRERVYRRRGRGERYADACVIERDRFGGGSVLVWGGIMNGQKTRLIVIQGNINAQSYIRDVLQPEVVPFINRNGPNISLMHDNARPHTAAVTRRFLANNNVNVLDWPANSPDLNPIEHIWDELGRRARQNHVINTVRDLSAALQVEWNNLAANDVQRYVDSMRQRVLTCIGQRGGHMRY